jgi:ATP-dependent RNA helicase DeaD
MELPSVKDINSKRTERFKTRVRETIANDDLALYYRLVSELEQEDDLDALQIAAALAQLAQGDVPLLLDPKVESKRPAKRDFEVEDRGRERRPARPERPRSHPQKVVETRPLPLKDFPDIEMERFRVAVGYQHGVKPGNIVGAIANEADLEARYIGHIEIFDDFSTVDLPAGMPEQTMRDLRNAWVCQQRLAIERLKDSGLAAASDPKRRARRPAKPGAEHERIEKPARKPRKGGSADKPLEGSAVDDKGGQGRPVERKSAATRRPGRKPAAKPAVTNPGSRPVGFKGKKKSKAAGDKPLKKRLTLKSGPKEGL